MAVEQNISAGIFARLDGQDPQGNICHKIREFYENRKKSATKNLVFYSCRQTSLPYLFSASFHSEKIRYGVYLDFDNMFTIAMK